MLVPTEEEQNLISQIERILDIKQQLSDKWWPEFNKSELSAPIIFYSDSVCYAVNPQKGFLEEFKCDRIKSDGFDLYKTARLDSSSFRMDTHVDLYSDTSYSGRTPYVMCSTLSESQKMFSDIPDETEWMPMVIHELVHGCQDSHPNHYIARQSIEYPVYELELASYPSQYPWLSDYLSVENDNLLKAIAACDKDEENEYIIKFLETRKARKEKMKDVFGESIVKLEEEFETAESMARFMEVQSALLLGNQSPKYAEDSEFFSQNVRQAYFFVTGYNLIRLFVKKGVDLDSPYKCQEHSPLEAYLEKRSIN